jgi:hypothetical protein
MDTRVFEIKWEDNRAGAIPPTPGLLEETIQRSNTSTAIARLEKQIADLIAALPPKPHRDNEQDKNKFKQKEREHRGAVVRLAQELKEANPRMTWKEIAKSFDDMPERTLRDWRHKYN